MLFPTPNVSRSDMASHDDSTSANPFQWENFDNVFDQVFAPSQKASPPSAHPFGGRRLEGSTPSDTPGGFRQGRIIGNDEQAVQNEPASFNNMWNNALRKTKKTTTTTTRRRIIRHTPEMDMPFPGVFPTTNMPTRPSPDHYRQHSFSDHSHSESDDDSYHMPRTPPHIIGGLPEEYSPSVNHSRPSHSRASSSSSYVPLRREKSK